MKQEPEQPNDYTTRQNEACRRLEQALGDHGPAPEQATPQDFNTRTGDAAEWTAPRAEDKPPARKRTRRKKPRPPEPEIIGLRAVYAGRRQDDPLRYIEVIWPLPCGKPQACNYSAVLHGELGAVELAMQRRESETGEKYGMTARQVWDRIKRPDAEKM